MNDREYLIKLLGGVEFQYTQMHSLMTENVADHLLQHGVTVQRHGRWVDKMVRDWHCSECGKKSRFDGYCYDDKPNYCPNCGAKMDGNRVEMHTVKQGSDGDSHEA